MEGRVSSDSVSMWRIAAVLAALAATICSGAVAGPRVERTAGAASVQQISEIPQLQLDLLTAINELRASRGLSQLRPNSALALASLAHSISMAKHGFFGHQGYDGSAFWQRIKARYRPSPSTGWEVGENLVWASPELSAREALDLWLQSPPHRKTLLTAVWRDVGVGAVRAQGAPGVYQGLDVTIVTADFGAR
jgi:uncharacterized protein YkwD